MAQKAVQLAYVQAIPCAVSVMDGKKCKYDLDLRRQEMSI